MSGKLDGTIAVITAATAESVSPQPSGRRRGRICLHHRPSSGGARRGGEGDRRNVTAIQGDVAKLADLDRLYATVEAKKGARRHTIRECR